MHILNFFEYIPTYLQRGSLLNLQMLNTKLNRSLIPKNTQPANDSLGFITQIAMMSKRLALVHISYMHFDKWYIDTG
jgi:hypothetical protein